MLRSGNGICLDAFEADQPKKAVWINRKERTKINARRLSANGVFVLRAAKRDFFQSPTTNFSAYCA